MKTTRTPERRSTPEPPAPAQPARRGVRLAFGRRPPPSSKPKRQLGEGAKARASALFGAIDPGQSVQGRLIGGDVTGVVIACLFLAGGLAIERFSSRQTASPSTTNAAPTDIPPRRWPQIFKAAFLETNRDRIPAVAAGVGFYGILSLFPAMAAFVSFYGLFGDVEKARTVLSLLDGLAPPETLQFIGDEMIRIAAVHQSQLSTTFAVGLLISIWSANAAMNALLGGLNVAYEQTEKRNFFALNLTSLAFTIGAIGVAVLSSAVIVAGAAARNLGVSEPALFAWLRWPAVLLAVMAMLAVLYRYGPSRAHAHWRWVSPGSLFAAFAWVLASGAFSVYVGRFGHYDRTYGPLAALIGFMVWFWLTVIITLFGAELNNEAERTPAPPKPLERPRR